MTDRLPVIRANVESGVLLSDESRWLIEQLAALRSKVAEAERLLLIERWETDGYAAGAVVISHPTGSQEVVEPKKLDAVLASLNHEAALAALRSTGDSNE